MNEIATSNAFWCFLMAEAEPWVAGILAQVPLPAKGSPSFTNLGVHTLWEVPLRGRCRCSSLQFRGAQRVLLRNAVYRVVRWLSSVTSKFSVCNPGLAITEIFKIPVRVVLFHSGYNSDKGCFPAVRGWEIIPTLLSHLGQAAGVHDGVSAAPTLALQEFPVQSRGASLLCSYTRARATIIESRCNQAREKRVRMHPHMTPFPLIKCIC